MRAALVLASLAALLPFFGCGGKTARNGGNTTTNQVLSSCLSRQFGATSVFSISPVVPGAVRGEPRASVAFNFVMGGPTSSNGVIAENPTNTLDVYVFSDVTTAKRAATLAGPAVARQEAAEARQARTTGNPTAQVGNTSANVIGRSVVVYFAGTAFGAGEPITQSALNATHSCLEQTGYG